MAGKGKTRVVNVRKERYDVYVGRPTVWGNPYGIHTSPRGCKNSTLARYQVASREEAIARYREWLLSQPELVARARAELRGKTLGCWCKPAPCHGDVLAEIADSEEGAE
jgi:hypothetical protein